jgi:hypothetical protein
MVKYTNNFTFFAAKMHLSYLLYLGPILYLACETTQHYQTLF